MEASFRVFCWQKQKPCLPAWWQTHLLRRLVETLLWEHLTKWPLGVNLLCSVSHLSRTVGLFPWRNSMFPAKAQCVPSWDMKTIAALHTKPNQTNGCADTVVPGLVPLLPSWHEQIQPPLSKQLPPWLKRYGFDAISSKWIASMSMITLCVLIDLNRLDLSFYELCYCSRICSGHFCLWNT